MLFGQLLHCAVPVPMVAQVLVGALDAADGCGVQLDTGHGPNTRFGFTQGVFERRRQIFQRRRQTAHFKKVILQYPLRCVVWQRPGPERKGELPAQSHEGLPYLGKVAPAGFAVQPGVECGQVPLQAGVRHRHNLVLFRVGVSPHTVDLGTQMQMHPRTQRPTPEQ